MQGPFPSRSGRLRRNWACIFAGLASSYAGSLIGSLVVGPFLFPPSPGSSRAENSTLIMATAFFLACGATGAWLCWRWTARWPQEAPEPPQRQTFGIVRIRARFLAIMTGLFTAIAASLGMGLLGAIVPGLLIAGAIMQPRLQRSGLLLMVAADVWLSSWMLPLGGLLLFDSVKALRFYNDRMMMMVTSVWAVSLLLLICCSASLVAETFRLKLFKAAES